MPFLIDGYNVYHAAMKLSEEWVHITPLNLCRLIDEDIHRLAETAMIVFDGAHPRGWRINKIEQNGNTRVIFSGPKSDADTLLEELISKNTAPRRLIVVSSDNRIRRYARRRRCTSLRANDYLVGMVKRDQQPPPRPKEPREKHQGVPEGQLDEWLKLFGIDPRQSTDETDFIDF
ncbi:MAG: NYN domain-containing protein [Sedimentisphaerales bacterium]|nr:NYN domain-containing protein [Sedimentisphaerales bacterium]